MSSMDVEQLLQEIDGAAPCGPNLEYDPEFVALEQAVLGKPEVQYGDTITAAVPPDWKSVQRATSALLARSRDLRLVMHALRANLALQGVPGLADALRLVERLLQERWDSVHPELDADDNMDPTLRINSLAILSDRATVLKDVKEATLIMLPGLGPLSLRMLEIATGEMAAPEGVEKIALGSIELALRDIDAAVLAAARETLASARDSVLSIEATLSQQVGNAQAPSLDALLRLLKRGHDFLAQNDDSDADDAGSAAEVGATEHAAHGTDVAPRRTAISGEIANRDDVVRMLDKLIGYYQQHEPSSPLPLLLLRAKRLVPKNFMEIMEDLAPDGMHQIHMIRGPQDEPPSEY